VQRFRGGPLPERPNIALTANDALGNFAVCTPLIQALQWKYPGCTLDYYGGERTKQFEERESAISWRCSLHGQPWDEVVQAARARAAEITGYHLVVNAEAGGLNKRLAAEIGQSGSVCGPCFENDSKTDLPFENDERGDLWRDKNWVDAGLSRRFSFLETGFIGEIFIRLCYIGAMPAAEWKGGIPKYRFATETPPIEIPEIIISTGASLSTKLWPLVKWRQFLARLRQNGFSVGLVGAPPKKQVEFYHSAEDESKLINEGLAVDLRGKLTLPQVAGALQNCKAVVTIDNGILHIAAAFDKPTVGLFRPKIANLWAPPNPNLRVVSANDAVAEISVEAVEREFQSFGLRA